MTSVPSNVAAHATAISAPYHPVWFHPPLPCIGYANVWIYYGPYAPCSLDKGVACAKHIQLPTETCARMV